ncbi:hypothetical protein EMGBS15_18870 [Filimonas sp.]|jgi:hypothetical protein|nr:hypothetical protein EMGBS15_18870 [Filimonas sp.]
MKLNNFFFPLLFLLFFSCKTPYTPASHTESLYSVKDTLNADTTSAIETFLRPYRDSLSGIMNEVIGIAAGDFHKEKSGGSLGNLITDAMFEEAQTHQSLCSAAIFNPGGIRIPDLMSGNITKGKLLELIPFDNELVILELKGSVLKKWMNTIGEANGWPIKFQVLSVKDVKRSSALFTYDTFTLTTTESSKSTNKMLEEIRHSPDGKLLFKQKALIPSFADTSYREQIDGSLLMECRWFDIIETSTYYIATNDYVANGGDHCDFLKDQKRLNTGLLIRDIVSHHIKTKKTVMPDNEARIQFND